MKLISRILSSFLVSISHSSVEEWKIQTATRFKNRILFVNSFQLLSFPAILFHLDWVLELFRFKERCHVSPIRIQFLNRRLFWIFNSSTEERDLELIMITIQYWNNQGQILFFRKNVWLDFTKMSHFNCKLV